MTLKPFGIMFCGLRSEVEDMVPITSGVKLTEYSIIKTLTNCRLVVIGDQIVYQQLRR